MVQKQQLQLKNDIFIFGGLTFGGWGAGGIFFQLGRGLSEFSLAGGGTPPVTNQRSFYFCGNTYEVSTFILNCLVVEGGAK